MRILWITNIALPPVCEDLGWKVPAVGGWMYSSLKRLRETPDCEIAVATIYPGNEMLVRIIDGVKYFLLPLRGKSAIRYNPHLEQQWLMVKEEFQPDVVHIHGSEFPHGLAYVRACGSEGVVVSIQGIISCLSRYYSSGIDFSSAKKCLTFKDIIKKKGLRKEQREFEKRGRLEMELLSGVNHIIGRTAWDKAHCWAINPEAQYHYCGETMRNVFYYNKWKYDSCEPHTIFVSQASYPIKGLHMLLEAMPLIRRSFPDVKIVAAGSDPTKAPWWRIGQYGLYLKKMIGRLGLGNHISFTGMLSEEEMCEAFLRANVFVCPSAIENSPNSLGEAQLLGMPYVATFAGGIPEIVNYNPEVLYRFEETEMLAKKICNIFEAKEKVKSAPFDSSRYDGERNMRELKDIYQTIAK